MKLFYYLSAFLFLVATPVLADVYIMKDGSKIEGELVKETETTYVVEIQVTRSIKDERKLLKSDVQTVEKSQVDLELFEEIKKMVPTPDAMPVDEYEKRIKFISKFLVTHKTSTKADDARDVLVELRSELNLLKEGGVKIGGLMLTPKQRIENAYDVDARVEALKLKKMIAERQLLPALRAFAQFEEDYKLSEAYAELVPEIRKVISSHATGTYQLLQTYDQRVEQREAGLTQMIKEDRRVSEQAIADQAVALEKLYQAEKSANIRWVSVHPYSRQALQYTIDLAKSESRRLANIAQAPPVDGGQLFRSLREKLQVTADERERKRLLHDIKRTGFSEKYLELLQNVKPVVKEPAEDPEEGSSKKAKAKDKKSSKK